MILQKVSKNILGHDIAKSIQNILGHDMAGSVHFKKFVVSLTNGYERLLTQMILWRIVELYRMLEPLLAAFLCSLDVAISLMLGGWSNCNLKGFYVVIAH
jgi:hypothetical protein